MASVQEVYIALFGRPADPLGLAFYNEATNNGQNLDAIGELSGSPEYQDRFVGMNDAQMINQIYIDLFGRDADADGLGFFVNMLRSGEATLQDIAIRIIDAARGSDQETVDAKVEAANAFTASLDKSGEIVAYVGEEAIKFGQDFLKDIRAAGDVPTQVEIDAATAEFVGSTQLQPDEPDEPNVPNVPDEPNEPNVPDQPGGSFTLTSSATLDLLEGTSQNDQFTAAAGTLQSYDILVGNGGVDTLNAVLGHGINTIVSPTLVSLEVLNFSTLPAGGSIGLSKSSGVVEAHVSGTGMFGLTAIDAATFKSVTLEEGYQSDFGLQFRSASVEDLDDAVVVLNLDGGVNATLADLSHAGISSASTSITLKIDSAGEAENSLSLYANRGDSVELPGIQVTGDQNFTLDLDARTENVTVDGSKATGDLTINGSAVVAGTDLEDDALTLIGGEGRDDLTGSRAIQTTFTGNAGGDTFEVSSRTDANTIESIDFATDFSSDDLIQFNTANAGTTVVFENDLDASYEAAVDLEAAADAALAAYGSANVVAFNYGGGQFIVGNDGSDDDFTAGTDVLIQVTGIREDNLSAANFAFV